jgi:hypothetical protein
MKIERLHAQFFGLRFSCFPFARAVRMCFPELDAYQQIKFVNNFISTARFAGINLNWTVNRMQIGSHPICMQFGQIIGCKMARVDGPSGGHRGGSPRDKCLNNSFLKMQVFLMGNRNVKWETDRNRNQEFERGTEKLAKPEQRRYTPD